MGKKFSTNVTTSVEARIDSYNVASIIEEEIDSLLGSKDRYIENGMIRESDYRSNHPDDIRPATSEEIELYKALQLVNRHFRELK